MNELFDQNLDIAVLESEYKRLLGYPADYVLKDRALELAHWARNWYKKNGKPWVYARRIDNIDLSNGHVSISGKTLTSKQLGRQFRDAGVDSGWVLVASAGKECEDYARQLWQEEKPDEYFFLEIYGSAVVEHLVTTIGARFCAWADEKALAVLPHYSPGYTGWDVSDQAPLLNLVKDNGLGQIEILESGMLKPKKSMLAVFGITAHVEKVQVMKDLIPCEKCSLLSCQYRKAPYSRSRSPIEDVSELQAGMGTLIDNSAKNILTQNTKYLTNIKALEKWANDRLDLNILEDGSVRAFFRYDGSTCSNMGHPLQYEYRVELGVPADGYKIKSLNCTPAPGDVGHTYMCRFIEDSEKLEEEIHSERPFLGRPLNDILSWKREFAPSGCYCNAESREYKWGMVLEVIHYKLTQREKQTVNDGKDVDNAMEYQL